jgi:hypothetical protein
VLQPSAAREFLCVTTRAKTKPSAAAVAAVPAIMYCKGRWGGGKSQRSHSASATKTSKPPVVRSTVRFNFGVTSPILDWVEAGTAGKLIRKGVLRFHNKGKRGSRSALAFRLF